VLEVTRGRGLRYSEESLVFPVGDAAVGARVAKGFPLPFALVQLGEKFVRKPITPNRDNDLVATLLEGRFGQVRLAARGSHVERARAGALGVVRFGWCGCQAAFGSGWTSRSIRSLLSSSIIRS
jgi:hypothetical protein